MSIATLKMPRLGETMKQGEIVTWLVEPGQEFKRGEAILEVETDKTAVEYPALGDGMLTEILADEGDVVAVGQPIARIDLGDAPDWTEADQEDDGDTRQTASTARTASAPDPVARPIAVGGRLRATPVARRLARQAGIDLDTLTGTGRRGRIEAGDVEANSGIGLRIKHGIAYLKTGPANGTPFLLLHGFAGDHTTFSLLSSGLGRAGACAVACDLPGHGATKIEAENTTDLSTNLAEFAASQFGQTPFHLVAHSLGAVPALALAETVDLASLTLIAPVGLGQEGNPEFLAALASPTSVKSVKALLELLTEKPNGLSKTAIKAIFEELSRARLVRLAEHLSARKPDRLQALEQVAQKTPTRILIGEKDRILASVDRYALPPEIAVHSFRNTGHMPHWEHPRAALKIILAAMERSS